MRTWIFGRTILTNTFVLSLVNILTLYCYFDSENYRISDIFEDYAAPVPAAQSLLHSVCKKRKGVLPKAMQIIMQVSELLSVGLS